MPARTNLIQSVVKIIEEEKGDFIQITESGMLLDKDTGGEREVDIVLKGLINGHEVVVSVEVVARTRRADSTWVESMTEKHQKLSTDKLVLVSRSGFTKNAKIKAEKNNIKIVDLSEGDRELRSYLQKAAYLVGYKVYFYFMTMIKGEKKLINPNLKAKIGKRNKELGLHAKDLYNKEDINEHILELLGEKEEEYIEIYYPGKFEITNLPPFNFKELFIIVHIQRQKVRVQLDSGKYDGVEFIWGVVGDQSKKMFLQSLDGKIQRMSG